MVSIYNKAGETCPGVSGALLAAQGLAESGFKADAIGRDKAGRAIAFGIAQFQPTTFAAYGNGGNINNPKDAIPAQARYMCSLMQSATHYSGPQLDVALALYNAGPKAVIKYNGVPPYPETRGYIKKIKGEMK